MSVGGESLRGTAKMAAAGIPSGAERKREPRMEHHQLAAKRTRGQRAHRTSVRGYETSRQ